VTTIRQTEFRKHEKPRPKQQLVDIMGYISFFPKTCIAYVSYYQKRTLYVTVQLTKTVRKE